MKHGIIAGSFKPFHAGHDALIRIAAGENNVVTVYVSIHDRAKKNEFPIEGAKMVEIWNDIISPTLPDNVDVEFVDNPISAVYETLDDAREELSMDKYTIYGDDIDTPRRFSEENLKKYASYLHGNGLVKVKPISRLSTVNVSGTEMRQHLQNDDRESFVNALPTAIDRNGIWSALKKQDLVF